MTLMRYTPFTDFETVPSFRLFQNTVNRLFAEPNGRPWVPPVDIKETENGLIFKADVPGMEMKDIELSLENGRLTLRGERHFEGSASTEGAVPPASTEGAVPPASTEGAVPPASTEGAVPRGNGWRRVERSYGKFERVFTLPDTVDVEKVKADYKAGTLTITLPKKEIAKPRQVKIEIAQ